MTFENTLLAMLVLFGLQLMNRAWWLAASLAIVGLGLGVSITTAFATRNTVIPGEVHATAVGFLSGASLIGIAVSPVLRGLLAARSIRTVFVTGAAS